MKQKYEDGEVIAPGTVIVTAAAHCSDITKVVEPVLTKDPGDLYYINISRDRFKLGGSSFAQTLNEIGEEAPGRHRSCLYGQSIQYNTRAHQSRSNYSRP